MLVTASKETDGENSDKDMSVTKTVCLVDDCRKDVGTKLYCVDGDYTSLNALYVSVHDSLSWDDFDEDDNEDSVGDAERKLWRLDFGEPITAQHAGQLIREGAAFIECGFFE